MHPIWLRQAHLWTLNNDDWVLSMGFVCNYICAVRIFLRYLRPYLWELTRAPNTGNKASQGKFCNYLHIVSDIFKFSWNMNLICAEPLWIFLLQISDKWFGSFPVNWCLSLEGLTRSITKIHLKLQNTTLTRPLFVHHFLRAACESTRLAPVRRPGVDNKS